MIKFLEWCDETEESISTHSFRRLSANPAKHAQVVETLAEVVPGYYADPSRVAQLLKKLGKDAAANFVEQKLPTQATIRSGDLGEILCTAYVHEATPFNLGIKRLRWKDHRNMSMRGEDVLAFHLSGRNGSLKILKAEVKSAVTMSSTIIGKARESLSANSGLPSPHAISFVADRLNESGDTTLGDALDKAQLKDGIKPNQVSHMLFTFSGNDPSNRLKTNLQAYAGTIPQHYVALCVMTHQAFIKGIFKAVIA
ncbi:MAG: Hachiman antiphage defense system protein HamA [Limnobacter sp.]|uniref:Hachiman antiphage defense system protein HamA n=1 Tax=Limnobacter sp. TaxID=2003368 RepID=UPI00300185A5